MKQRKFFSLVMGILLFFGLISASIQSVNYIEEIPNKDIIKNYIAVKLNSVYQETVKNNADIEEYYAGCYIDSNSNYNILFTNTNSIKKLKDIFTESKIHDFIVQLYLDEGGDIDAIPEIEVLYQKAKHTYSYLESLKDILSKNASELHITNCRIKQASNTVDVYIDASSEQNFFEHKESIKEYLSEHLQENFEEAVRFMNGKPYQETAASTSITPYPGNKLYYGIQILNGYGTIGFHAKDSDGNYGVVTCGHVAPYGTTMKYYDGNTIGTTSFSYIGGYVDVAFVPFDNTLSVTCQSTYYMNEVGTSNYRSIYDVASSSDIVEGVRVVKYGAATGERYGYIESTSEYITSSGNNLGDVVTYDIYSSAGDSGGPVGLLAPIAKAKFYLMCIHVAKHQLTGIGAGVKVSNIIALSSLDITPVTSLNP